ALPTSSPAGVLSPTWTRWSASGAATAVIKCVRNSSTRWRPRDPALNVPVVLGSANARIGFPAAIDVLRDGGSAMEAAVAAVRCVEDSDDHGVGTGGIPNVLGEVELDASVMDGRTLAAGAVAAVKGFRHPIEIARKVMETTPHVFLA